MNKYLMISMMLLLLIPLVSAEVSLSAEMLKYEPIPAQPGQYVTVYLELENTGNEDATDAVIIIDDDFPFSVVGDSEIDIGLLKSRRSFVEEFRLRVDSEAPVGMNPLKIRYTGNGDDWFEKDVSINVKSNDASLTITEVEVDKISPGEEGSISVTIKNNADIVLRNIAMQLNMVTVQGSTIIDLPFIPTNSATEKKITKLNPGEITKIDFDVSAYPSATPGYYKLPLTITFFDEQGTETESQDYVGVVVDANPELKVFLEESKLYEGANQGDITLKFVNKGINDLKFLDVTLLEDEGYEVIGHSANYIGDLDSDDYRSDTFTIKANEENVELKVDVTFKDENNKDYKETISVPLRYGHQSGNGDKNYTGTIVIILLVVIVGIILWRRRSKKRRR